jgi:acyl dehydratase
LTVKAGWPGRFFEDFAIGDVYQHALGRTITSADIVWITLLTQNTALIHFDHQYAAQVEFGKPLVNSCLTLSLVTGQTVSEVSENVIANLGWDEVRLPHPVFDGDTVYSRSEVLEIREFEIAQERGYCYGAHDRLQPGRHPGDIAAADSPDLPPGARAENASTTQGSERHPYNCDHPTARA